MPYLPWLSSVASLLLLYATRQKKKDLIHFITFVYFLCLFIYFIFFLKLASRRGCIFNLLFFFFNTCSYILLFACFALYDQKLNPFLSSPSSFSFLQRLLLQPSIWVIAYADAFQKATSIRVNLQCLPKSLKFEKKIEISGGGIRTADPLVHPLGRRSIH